MGLFPIQITADRIVTPTLAPSEGFRRFREAILDGHVPVAMPIGFALKSPKTLTTKSAVGRSPCCQESMIAVATNLQGLIFSGDVKSIVSSPELMGRVSTGTTQWTSGGQGKCTPIDPSRYILSSTSPIRLQLQMRVATGRCSLEENAALLKDTTYFPLATTHTLSQYVKVLPSSDGTIRVRYHNGMNPNLLQALWGAAQEE